MRTIILQKTLLYLIVSLTMSLKTFGQENNSNNNWTKEQATEWLNSKTWTNGLDMKVYEAVDVIEFAKQYNKNKKYWKKAFEFLKNNRLDTIKAGKYPIVGDTVYASVTNNKPKAFEDTKWEAHKKYIDIQYVVNGKEKIGIASVLKGIILETYNEKNDVGFYSFSDNDCHYYIAQPDTFLIFFPGDSHRPNIKVEGHEAYKKIVIKVKAD